MSNPETTETASDLVVSASACVAESDCLAFDGGHVCTTAMAERSRRSEGVHWCFGCRQRRDFVRVVSSPTDPMSYYGPSVDIRCGSCGLVDGDLFPGRFREWEGV